MTLIEKGNQMPRQFKNNSAFYLVLLVAIGFGCNSMAADSGALPKVITTAPLEFNGMVLPKEVTTGMLEFNGVMIPKEITTGQLEFNGVVLPKEITTPLLEFNGVVLPQLVTTSPLEFNGISLPKQVVTGQLEFNGKPNMPALPTVAKLSVPPPSASRISSVLALPSGLDIVNQQLLRDKFCVLGARGGAYECKSDDGLRLCEALKSERKVTDCKRVN